MTEPPKIEFPCDYPVKVIAEAQVGLLEEVFMIVQRHDPSIHMDRVTERPSSGGNYHAITLQLRATGVVQLQNLFEDLKACEAVRLVL
ncbi:MAG: YbeD family protein [Pseudomonadota bacterium]